MGGSKSKQAPSPVPGVVRTQVYYPSQPQTGYTPLMIPQGAPYGVYPTPGSFPPSYVPQTTYPGTTGRFPTAYPGSPGSLPTIYPGTQSGLPSTYPGVPSGLPSSYPGYPSAVPYPGTPGVMPTPYPGTPGVMPTPYPGTTGVMPTPYPGTGVIPTPYPGTPSAIPSPYPGTPGMTPLYPGTGGTISPSPVPGQVPIPGLVPGQPPYYPQPMGYPGLGGYNQLTETDFYHLAMLSGLSVSTIAQLAVEFQRLTAGTGRLDRDQYRRLFFESFQIPAMQNLERLAEQSFREFDRDSNGCLDFSEFIAAYKNASEGVASY